MVVTHRLRPGKSAERYFEPLIDDDGRRVHTLVTLAQRWPRARDGTEWYAGLPRPHSIAKYLFYGEWFGIMQWRDAAGRPYLHYCDICTPVEKRDGEYWVLDLFLDLVIEDDGTLRELDRDEFRAAVARGMLTPEQEDRAEVTLAKLRTWAEEGRFPRSHTSARFP